MSRLSATLDTDGTLSPDSACLCEPIEQRLPDRLVASEGVSTGLEAELVVRDPDGLATRTCRYVGKGVSDIATATTAFFALAGCDVSTTAGTRLTTDDVTLRLLEPSTLPAAPVEVTAPLIDEPCLPPATLSEQAFFEVKDPVPHVGTFGSGAPVPEPTAFSPGTQSGLKNRAILTVRLEQVEDVPSTYVVTEFEHQVSIIATATGQMVRSFTTTTQPTTAVGQIVTMAVPWDGKSSTLVPDGEYHYRVTSTLKGDDISQEGLPPVEGVEIDKATSPDSEPLFVDNTAPTLSVALREGLSGAPVTIGIGDVVTVDSHLIVLEGSYGDEREFDAVLVEIGGRVLHRIEPQGFLKPWYEVVIPLPWHAIDPVSTGMRVIALDTAGNLTPIDSRSPASPRALV